jgi:DNA-binding Lrp family transcriptional regulator
MTYREQFDDIFGEVHLLTSDHIGAGEIGERLYRLFMDNIIKQEGAYREELATVRMGYTATIAEMNRRHAQKLAGIEDDHCKKMEQIVQKMEKLHAEEISNIHEQYKSVSAESPKTVVDIMPSLDYLNAIEFK